MIADIINIICMCFTFTGARIQSGKGDRIIGWYIYTIAAVFGIAYFILTGNMIQLSIWIYFFVNDLLAIRRKKLESRKKGESQDASG